MPTNTYVALDKATVTTATSTVTFTAIPSGYTDLVLVIGGAASSAQGMFLYFNNDTAANYSRTYVYGTGSSAISDRVGDHKVLEIGTAISTVTASVMNYSNTTTFKTTITRGGSASNLTIAEVGLWRNTAAINRIDVVTGTGTINVGTTISLYGIKTANAGVAKATGGTIAFGGDGYIYHTFTAGGTFTPNQTLSCDILMIAGGGGGGQYFAGAGGAGGVVDYAAQSLSATGYTIAIGAGGAGNTSGSARGANGTDTTFTGLTTALGGGGGSTPGYAAGNGGNGGGGSYANPTGGTGSGTQGKAGGNSGASAIGGGGGGSYAAVGGNGGASYAGGTGGTGFSSTTNYGDLTQTFAVTGRGVSGLIGGGGGGGGSVSRGTANGGGGQGGFGAVGPGANGTANTGGGGGGGSDVSYINGYNGGSGLVIIRYAG
jgi:hypothetical protein